MCATGRKSSKLLSSLGLVVILGVLSCSDDDEAAVELFKDDMEGAVSWDFANVAPAAHVPGFSDDIFASPSHSISISSDAEAANGHSYASSTVTPSGAHVGAKLELSVKVKTVDVTGPGAYLALRGVKGSMDGFFVTTQGNKTITGTQEFTTYSVTLGSYPDGITEVYIFLILDGKSSGTVYFDDVVLIARH